VFGMEWIWGGGGGECFWQSRNMGNEKWKTEKEVCKELARGLSADLPTTGNVMALCTQPMNRTTVNPLGIKGVSLFLLNRRPCSIRLKMQKGQTDVS
jgi:hypothetical protein